MKAGHLIFGYHGCDVVVREELVSRRLAFLDQSRNDYDWLVPASTFSRTTRSELNSGIREDRLVHIKVLAVGRTLWMVASSADEDLATPRQKRRATRMLPPRVELTVGISSNLPPTA